MYRVEVRHRKDFTFTVKSGDHEFTVDAKGKDGITPPDVLLASLGSCIGVYIRKYAESAKLPLEGFCVKVEADFCKEPPQVSKPFTFLWIYKAWHWMSAGKKRLRSLLRTVLCTIP